ncbi:hypothetical protein ACCS86_37425, partial [Rhizobium ruizarguesonis]
MSIAKDYDKNKSLICLNFNNENNLNKFENHYQINQCYKDGLKDKKNLDNCLSMSQENRLKKTFSADIVKNKNTANDNS